MSFEITRPTHIWYRNGVEIDAFPTRESAEATIRRVLKLGWGNNILFDLDGSVLKDGRPLVDTIVVETRRLDGSVVGPIDPFAPIHDEVRRQLAGGVN